jgi:glucose-1-phosphate thymidylyltransferase
LSPYGRAAESALKKLGVYDGLTDRIVNGENVAQAAQFVEPRGDWAVAGLYLSPPDVFDFIRQLRPSARGELEITDLNRLYLAQGRLSHSCLDGYWTDAGTPDSLELANKLVHEQPPLF